MSKRPRETDGPAAEPQSPEAKRHLAVNVPQPQAAVSPAILDPEYQLPTGWLDCPSLGHTIRQLQIIPIKVPLGRKFDRVVPEDKRFTPGHVIDLLKQKQIEIGLVIDLTNTWRYYQAEEWQGIPHYKIRCRGRGEAPDTETVNEFCWTVLLHKNLWQAAGTPQLHIVVHCTHGFNRTGFMIANYMLRNNMSMSDAVHTFAQHRPPGIYKCDYLDRLFKYAHEHRPETARTPELPDWKANAPPSPAANGHATEEEPAGAPEDAEPREIQHDDPIGEFVVEEEAQEVQKVILTGILNPDGNREIERVYFPGSQPVSLAQDNLRLLGERRYWVTWKADGTRYMLAIFPWGTYLVDRAFCVRRVQMRFPTALHVPPGHKVRPGVVVGKSHAATLLDGEMVVDDDLESGERKRRFLAYDIMMLNGKSLIHKPFKDRYGIIEEEVMKPRHREREEIERNPKYRYRYIYTDEEFSVRRKAFWPLYQSRSLLDKFIPNLSHEADGLILQAYEDPYIPGTCNELLKYKFAHLNSVDFLLQHAGGAWQLCLLETRGNAPRKRGLQPLEGAVVSFPEGEQLGAYDGKIIECVWNSEAGSWVYHRVRSDKDTPNAYHVYEKVMKSIEDNITNEMLLGHIDEAIRAPVYAKDVQHR
ncbi:hypothetical protein WJX72_001811 [[Myrmecia] bisecta]|uniref:mRNA guanylyltransferase n=1 Tax=[Myrmecia] bisecta TaxID=41462 RepID=A0AAW1R634_9CHLO